MRLGLASGARQIGFFAGDAAGGQGLAAAMTEASFVADPRQAFGTDSMHVPLVQCEIRTAMLAGFGTFLSWGSATAAPDDCRIVSLGLLDPQHLAAPAMEFRPGCQLPGFVLAAAIGAGNK